MTDLILEHEITLDDYLLRCQQTTDRVEILDGLWWINGGLGVDIAGGTGWKHQRYGKNILDSLTVWVKNKRLGLVMPDGTTYRMFSLSSNLRNAFIPDVSFVTRDNLPPDNHDEDLPHPGVPNFAVEIFSVGNDAEEMRQKVRTYLEKGTDEVWVVFPKLQEVHQNVRGENVTHIYKMGDIVRPATPLTDWYITVEMIFDLSV
jgi:Uma2 family endonuclease